MDRPHGSKAAGDPQIGSSRAIRVLIVDDAIEFGGSIVSTANLIRRLDRRLVDVTFVSGASRSLIEHKLKEAAASARIAIRRKAFHYRARMRLRRLIERLPGRWVRKVLINSLFPVQLVANLPYMLRVAALPSFRRADLVQHNNGFGNEELSLLCWLFRKPQVLFLRGYWPMGTLDRRLSLPRTRAFVAVSDFISREAQADGVSADRMWVATPPTIPEPRADGDRAHSRARFGLTDTDLVIGMVGRIIPWKGHLAFLQALNRVAEKVPGVKALIVGDASDGDSAYFEEVRDYVEQAGLGANVEFTGYVEEIHELYTAVDLIAHTSIEGEPSGRVISEGMSYGRPVIASSLGGAREVITDGVDGFIVDPRDPDALSDRIIELLADPALRARVGNEARAAALERFDADRYAARIVGIYRRCVLG